MPRPSRYGDIAIGLHWLIAILIISLLAIGKLMSELDESSPLRYALTQWHKSVGITVLLLSVVRLLWRFSHAAPAHPANAPAWEKSAASLSHIALYVLMAAAPITGWMMVSASPLNIDTLLYNVIPWPHIAWIADLSDKADKAHLFHEIHNIATNLLLALVVLHVGAALKHHVINKDDVLTRIAPDWTSKSFTRKLQLFALTIALFGAGLFFLASNQSARTLVNTGPSQVGFTALVGGEEVPGLFTRSDVTIELDQTNLANSTMLAIVDTTSFDTANYQVKSSLPNADWFATDQFPESRFLSTQFDRADDGGLLVTGALTIKKTTQTVHFPMHIEDRDNKQVVVGSFVIQRLDFDIGADSQADDSTVGYEVTITFLFELRTSEP